MRFKFETVENLLKTYDPEIPTGDEFLDGRYEEQVRIVGHTQPYYRLFWHLARTLRPKLSVELGSWQATAAAHLAAGNPQGNVITIDVHKDDPAAKVRTEEAAEHYANLEYVNGWTWDVVGRVPRGIDLLFVDSWHDYQYAIQDWRDYSALLSPAALVICDDILPGDPSLGYGMRRFWAEISEGRESVLDAAPHPGIPMGFFRWTA